MLTFIRFRTTLGPRSCQGGGWGGVKVKVAKGKSVGYMERTSRGELGTRLDEREEEDDGYEGL